MKMKSYGMLVLGLVLVSSGQLSGATVTVTPSSLNGWATYTTDSSGVIPSMSSPGVAADFVNGPASPPLGTGSAHLTTGTNHGDESAQFRTTNFAGIKIGDLVTLSYSTYVSAWNGQQLPYLTIWLDLDGNGSRDDRLWFEPAYSGVSFGRSQPDPVLNTWQTWDALNGYWYSDNQFGPGSNAVLLSTYLAVLSNANATIIDAAPGLGGFRIASGFASTTDNFDANFDNVTLATASGSTTYNFEPGQIAAVPEPASTAIWSVAGLFGLAYRRCRCRRREK